jgi:hypothetical protein
MVQAYRSFSKGSQSGDEKSDMAFEKRGLQHDHCGYNRHSILRLLPFLYGFDLLLGDFSDTINILRVEFNDGKELVCCAYVFRI